MAHGEMRDAAPNKKYFENFRAFLEEEHPEKAALQELAKKLGDKAQISPDAGVLTVGHLRIAALPKDEVMPSEKSKPFFEQCLYKIGTAERDLHSYDFDTSRTSPTIASLNEFLDRLQN